MKVLENTEYFVYCRFSKMNHWGKRSAQITKGVFFRGAKIKNASYTPKGTRGGCNRGSLSFITRMELPALPDALSRRISSPGLTADDPNSLRGCSAVLFPLNAHIYLCILPFTVQDCQAEPCQNQRRFRQKNERNVNLLQYIAKLVTKFLLRYPYPIDKGVLFSV